MYVQARFDVTWVRSKNRKRSSSSSSSGGSGTGSGTGSGSQNENSNDNCVGGIEDTGADMGVGEDTDQRQERGKIRGSAVVYVHGTVRTDWR
jgi:hypothetical protein